MLGESDDLPGEISDIEKQALHELLTVVSADENQGDLKVSTCAIAPNRERGIRAILLTCGCAARVCRLFARKRLHQKKERKKQVGGSPKF
jgi:hypothetical protein